MPRAGVQQWLSASRRVAGNHDATFSKRLGHANVHVTATVYSHALPEDEIAAAQIWNNAMSETLAPAAQPEAPRARAKAAGVVPIDSGKKSA